MLGPGAERVCVALPRDLVYGVIFESKTVLDTLQSGKENLPAKVQQEEHGWKATENCTKPLSAPRVANLCPWNLQEAFCDPLFCVTSA